MSERVMAMPLPAEEITWDPSLDSEAPAAGIPDDELEDGVSVADEGREIERVGIRYLVDGLIPAYGMLAFLVAFAKVGKTSLGQALAAAVAMGRSFLDRETVRSRVLVLAAEDPPEYVAWLARHLDIEPGWLLFRRRPLILDAGSLGRICETVRERSIGLVLVVSWQAVIRGLVKDENDNAGAVQIVERVKQAARCTGVPWLVDAHSGKGEDQDDDADPSRAMRGASAAAGAADYTLSLRYGNGAFGTQRRLSGKGRFVSFAPMTLDFDAATSTYTVVGDAKSVARQTTWRLICETGALSDTPRSATDLARAVGIIRPGERPTGNHRRRITDALQGRPDVGIIQDIIRGQKATLYKRLNGTP